MVFTSLSSWIPVFRVISHLKCKTDWMQNRTLQCCLLRPSQKSPSPTLQPIPSLSQWVWVDEPELTPPIHPNTHLHFLPYLLAIVRLSPLGSHFPFLETCLISLTSGGWSPVHHKTHMTLHTSLRLWEVEGGLGVQDHPWLSLSSDKWERRGQM